MVKIDPYKHKERYEKWKDMILESGVPFVSKVNSDILIQYVTDMEHGLNVSLKSTRGGRSFIRLNSLREKMVYFVKKFSEYYELYCIADISEEQVMIFFSKC